MGKKSKVKTQLNHPKDEYVCLEISTPESTEKYCFHPDNLIKVLIGGDVLAEKRPGDISKGNSVLLKKRIIETTEKELESLVSRNSRYQEAGDKLYKSGASESVTIMRYNLIKGCYAQGVFGDANEKEIEDKILRKAPDFSKDEYQEMARHIRKVIVKNQKGSIDDVVQEQTITVWLRGIGRVRPREGTAQRDTLFPRKWEVFDALSSLNPEFKKFYEDFKNSRVDESADNYNPENIHDAYDYYTGVNLRVGQFIYHTGNVLRKISAGAITKDEADKKMQALTKRGKYDLIPIFRDIIKHFDGKEIQYFFGEVVSKRITVKEEFQELKSEEPKSRPKVHQGRLELQDSKVLSRKELLSHMMLVGHVYELFAMDYFFEKFQKIGVDEVLGTNAIAMLSLHHGGLRNAEVNYLAKRLENNENPFAEHQLKLSRELYELANSDRGLLGGNRGIEPSFFPKLYKTLLRLCDAIPSAYYSIRRRMNEIRWNSAEKMGANRNREFNIIYGGPYMTEEALPEFVQLFAMKEKIFDGITNIPALPTTLYISFISAQWMPERTYEYKIQGAIPKGIRQQYYHDLVFMNQMIELLKINGMKLMTEDETSEILGMYRLQEGMKIVPQQNFIDMTDLEI